MHGPLTLIDDDLLSHPIITSDVIFRSELQWLLRSPSDHDHLRSLGETTYTTPSTSLIRLGEAEKPKSSKQASSIRQPEMAAPSTAPRAPVIYCLPTADVAPRLGDFVIKAQDEALAKRKKFTLAVSGGSLAKQLVSGLSGREGVQWDKWIVFFADERLVPLDDEESNYRIVNEGLFSKVPILPENIHAINTEHLDDPEEISHDYEKQLMNEFAGKNSVAFPRFDLVLLGTGPDGHTCSLFPKHPLLSEELRWVAWLDDSPKPPAKRITLTLPVLNHAHKVAFVAVGEGKQEILEKVLDQPALGLPATKVKPSPPGTVYWFIDEAAGQLVKHHKTEFKL